MSFNVSGIGISLFRWIVPTIQRFSGALSKDCRVIVTNFKKSMLRSSKFGTEEKDT